jgi:hypothetical protein
LLPLLLLLLRRRRQVADDFEALRLKLDPSALALPEEPEPAPVPTASDRGSLARFTSILNRLEVRAARMLPRCSGGRPRPTQRLYVPPRAFDDRRAPRGAADAVRGGPRRD